MSHNNTTTIICSRSKRTRFCHLKMYLRLGLFTCSLLHCVHAAIGVNDARFVYNKSKTDGRTSAENTDTNVKLLEENETDPFPTDFYTQLNNVTNISEFIAKYVDPKSIDPQLGFYENSRRSVERAAAVLAEPASCIPEKTIVNLRTINPNNYYIPHCTRVNRCGGCCHIKGMSCQPTETEIINLKVIRFTPGDVKPVPCGFDIVSVEQHLKCKCKCIQKPEDCKPYERYQDCRCHCMNDEAREKCSNQEHKIWDSENCRCVCNQNENCTTGSYFDPNECKCLLHKPNPVDNSGDFVANRRRLIIKPIEVDPDNSTIYEL